MATPTPERLNEVLANASKQDLWSFARELERESELLRRRMVHATRPKGPLTAVEANRLHAAMEGCPAWEPPL